MSRLARFRLSQEDRERINLGLPVRLHTFGGDCPQVFVKSLQHVNPDAWKDHLFEMRLDGRRLIFSASELLQALNSV